MSHTKDRIEQEIEQLSNDLQGLADEIRLKIHLAGMDARDAWARLEPQLRDFERRLERDTELAVTELRGAGHDLRDRLHRLREQL